MKLFQCSIIIIISIVFDNTVEVRILSLRHLVIIPPY